MRSALVFVLTCLISLIMIGAYVLGKTDQRQIDYNLYCGSCNVGDGRFVTKMCHGPTKTLLCDDGNWVEYTPKKGD